MFVLVVKASKDSWHDMSIHFDKVKETYEKDPDYYRIERWTYYRYDTGDKLMKQEKVDAYGRVNS